MYSNFSLTSFVQKFSINQHEVKTAFKVVGTGYVCVGQLMEETNLLLAAFSAAALSAAVLDRSVQIISGRPSFFEVSLTALARSLVTQLARALTGNMVVTSGNEILKIVESSEKDELKLQEKKKRDQEKLRLYVSSLKKL